MKLKVVITGRSYDLASDLPELLELSDGGSLNQAIEAINVHLGEHSLAPTCLIAVGGNHVGTVSQHEDCVLQDGQEIVFLQPVAGG